MWLPRCLRPVGWMPLKMRTAAESMRAPRTASRAELCLGELARRELSTRAAPDLSQLTLIAVSACGSLRLDQWYRGICTPLVSGIGASALALLFSVSVVPGHASSSFRLSRHDDS